MKLSSRFGVMACASALAAAMAVAPAVAQQKTFTTPQQASEALIAAAAAFDVTALKEILGPDGEKLVVSEDPVQDKNQAAAFAAQAKAKMKVVLDPKNPKHASLVVGDDDWPTPFPIVEKNGRWSFDSKKGQEEVLFRRIGSNELDAIDICHGYVEAQHEYAFVKHEGSPVNQYAQRIISSPGKQDGLAWRTPEGTWEGPIGENIARIISEGYASQYEPYHGYYFKVLKSQGPAAPLGAMDYVVKGSMIGGFALVAAPAEYAVTGVKTFIVASDGVVYEKDLGPKTVEQFRAMDRYNPDSTWKPVAEQ